MTSPPRSAAHALAEKLAPTHGAVAVASVTSASTTVAVQGAPAEADFEIGSISKGVTGLLFADALARGEISTTTTLGDVLPLAGAEAKAITLASISTHRSGLPSLPRSMQPWRRTIALWRHGTNPYGDSLDELLEQARTVRVGSPRPRYSNVGFELLGHALAAAAGTTYADLVASRITRPLGLGDTYLPSTPDELRSTALRGATRRGRPREPWTGEALAPAGGIRSTGHDMAALISALLDGSAPGIAALDPVADLGASRIGAAWITTTVKGRHTTWHNGGTGGFRSWLGIDRDAGVGVVVLSARSITVDGHGFVLLADLVRR